MRILGALLLLVACGPKAGTPAKDFTLHDKLLVTTADAVIAIDARTGVVVPVTSGVPAAAIWAGRCVVYVHDGQLSVVDPVTDKRWDLDDSATGTLVASPDGTRVRWACTDDDGAAAVCETAVDGSGEVELREDGLPDGACWPAGDREVCRTDRGVMLDGADEAYLDAGALYVIRGGAAARKLAEGPFASVLDWRP